MCLIENNAKRFIGNTLEKPQLILKRMKVRDTNFGTEIIKDGTSYQEIPAEIQYNKKKKSKKNKHQYKANYFSNNIEKVCCLQNEIYGFQNFLRNATKINHNLIENEEGIFECEFNTSKYTNILILATWEKSTTQVIFDLEDTTEIIEKRNLSLSDPLDYTKFFNEVRNTDLIYSESTYKIQNITSTDYILVDCLDKVKKITDNICEIKQIQVEKDLFFLLHWNTLSDSEKNIKFGEFEWHEVNLFLYFKDFKYFEKVVKPFINSKMEKTFIDHWLLEDYNSIFHYQEIGYFDKLNTLEQSLLAYAVMTINKEMAKTIARRIQEEADANSKESPEFKNKLFDTVLSLNLLQNDKAKEELKKRVSSRAPAQRRGGKVHGSLEPAV